MGAGRAGNGWPRHSQWSLNQQHWRQQGLVTHAATQAPSRLLNPTVQSDETPRACVCTGRLEPATQGEGRGGGPLSGVHLTSKKLLL